MLQVCVCFYLGSELLQHANNNKREGRSSTHLGCSLVSARAHAARAWPVYTAQTQPRHAPNHASPASIARRLHRDGTARAVQAVQSGTPVAPDDPKPAAFDLGIVKI